MKRNTWLVVLGCAALAATAQNGEKGWLASWAADPQQQTGTLKPLANQTVRAYVPLTAGGTRLRVRFSNEYGTKPLMIGAASVGLTGPDGAMEPGTLHKLAFGGADSIQIPVGAPAYADAVDMKVPAFGTVAVSVFLPKETMPETYHRLLANQDQPGAAKPVAEISGAGNFTMEPKIAAGAPSPYLFVSRVDVLDPKASGSIVVMGTTRTEGAGHWPQFLAERMNKSGKPVAVVNASLVANPLLRAYPGGGDAGLARFDRDVLMLPGITHVVIADAINDIGQPGGNVVSAAEMPTLENLQAAYLQLTARARSRGVKVIAATLMPFEGVPFPGFYSPEKEKLRLALNDWIRAAKAFDGIIDLDAMLRDPDHPSKFLPNMHTANNFAPNDAGEHKIADALDLKLFR
jgi:lysophospholipase L1-like esterase